jgi:hypothetical protein
MCSLVVEITFTQWNRTSLTTNFLNTSSGLKIMGVRENKNTVDTNSHINDVVGG